MTAAAVVLAAGGGSRFAGPTHKLLAPWRGRPLVLAAIESAVAAGLDETVVVSGAADLTAVAPAGCTLLHNQRWSEGQATSLRVAIDWLERQGHDAAVVGLGDAPLIPGSAWIAVAAARAGVAVATFGGRRHPPVRLVRAVWPELPVSGDEGARGLLRRPGVEEVPCDGEPLDVDTDEDYARLLAFGAG